MPRGRPPKPSTTHWLNGDPSRTRRYEVEPSGASGAPKKPKALCEVASAKWDEMFPLLSEMRVLTRSDADALRLYCETFALYVKACEAIEAGEMVGTSDKGVEYKSPYVSIRFDCLAHLEKMLIEFGFTPAARARMRYKPTEEKQASKWAGKLKIAGKVGG